VEQEIIAANQAHSPGATLLFYAHSFKRLPAISKAFIHTNLKNCACLAAWR